MINNLELYKNKKVIIALSGGPDSVFLLLNTLKVIKNVNIIACHVNYNYRNDSIKDQNICEKICKKYGVKLFVKTINQDYKLLKENFESWARDIRYSFFKEIYDKETCDVIFTGHNLNDSCETYLIQKERKTIVNYFGMRKNIEINNCEIFRPMLEIKKSEILDYLDKRIKDGNIEEYAIDSTNYDTKFLRNKIRTSLKDLDLQKIKEEIDDLNIKQKPQIKKINSFISDKFFLNIEDLKKNFESIEIEKIIYKFFFKFGLDEKIKASKKNFIKEMVKQLSSDKSFVEFRLKNKIFIKDRNFFSYIPNDFDDIFECNINDKNERKEIFMNWKYLQKYEGSDYLVTNNWRKYKDFIVQGKKIKLKDIYKRRKYSYIERFFNLLLIDYKRRNIKLLYLKNVNIYERNNNE